MNTETLQRTEGILGLAMLILLAVALVVGQAQDRAGTNATMRSAISAPATIRLIETAAEDALSSSGSGLRRFAVSPLPTGLGVDLEPLQRRGGAGGGVREL